MQMHPSIAGQLAAARSDDIARAAARRAQARPVAPDLSIASDRVSATAPSERRHPVRRRVGTVLIAVGRRLDGSDSLQPGILASARPGR